MKGTIYFIAALDSKQGIANNNGIPWQGKIPTDVKHFRDSTIHQNVLMGTGWYKEQTLPLENRRNFVATTSTEKLRPGFEKVTDAREFLRDSTEDVWVGGGAGLFDSTIDLADILDLTIIEQDFNCTKFFPEFKDKFEMFYQSQPITENGITYTFTKWKRKNI